MYGSGVIGVPSVGEVVGGGGWGGGVGVQDPFVYPGCRVGAPALLSPTLSFNGLDPD